MKETAALRGRPLVMIVLVLTLALGGVTMADISFSNRSSGGSALPVVDTTALVKGSGDPTKLVRFEVDGLTTATTRAITPPDGDTIIPLITQALTFTGPTAARSIALPDAAFTIAGLGVAQTFSAANVFTPGIVTFGTAQDAASSIMFNETANCITFEGTVADGSEGRICGSNGGIDATTSLPYVAATQTFAILEGAQTFTGSKLFNVTINYARTITAAGTTGAQTINLPAGTVNFAAAATTIVVTDSLVTANSIIFLNRRTNDATCLTASAEPAAGSFTIRMTAACTAETSVGFLVTN